MTITEPDTARGLYRKYELFRVNEDDHEHRYQVFEPFFVLRYTTDPHARAALEAYADSCRDDFPVLADDLYRALGLDCSTHDQAAVITPELNERLSSYRGQWVAIRNSQIVAFSSTLPTLRAMLDEFAEGLPVTVLRVPAEVNRDTASS